MVKQARIIETLWALFNRGQKMNKQLGGSRGRPKHTREMVKKDMLEFSLTEEMSLK